MKSLRQVRAAARYPPIVKQKFQSRLRSSLRLKRLQTAKQPPAQPKTEQAAFLFPYHRHGARHAPFKERIFNVFIARRLEKRLVGIQRKRA